MSFSCRFMIWKLWHCIICSTPTVNFRWTNVGPTLVITLDHGYVMVGSVMIKMLGQHWDMKCIISCYMTAMSVFNITLTLFHMVRWWLYNWAILIQPCANVDNICVTAGTPVACPLALLPFTALWISLQQWTRMV